MRCFYLFKLVYFSVKLKKQVLNQIILLSIIENKYILIKGALEMQVLLFYMSVLKK